MGSGALGEPLHDRALKNPRLHLGVPLCMGWFQSMAAIEISFFGANTADALSTFAALNVGAVEANPIISTAMEASSIPTVLIGKLLVGAAVAVLVGRWKPRLLKVPTIVFALIAVTNSVIAVATSVYV